MPTLEDSRRLVQDALAAQAREPSHAHILASLEAEIDKHNAARQDSDDDGKHPSAHYAERTRKLRFKKGDRERSRKRVRRSHRNCESRDREQKSDDDNTAHPFPREPTDADHETAGADAAFRESLFDALADDEGAQYWESIYDQPIHVYPRPKVETPMGTLEEMSDDQYARYVKTQMWEKKNPHVVYERERMARKRKEAEEERVRERERFVRQKQQAAWERSQRHGRRYRGSDGDDSADANSREYEFTGHGNMMEDNGSQHVSSKAYTEIWERYNQAWDKLKHELLQARSRGDASRESSSALTSIPWPILPGKTLTSANITDFFVLALGDERQHRDKLLKAERVRWHPDKIQQRFGGRVDDNTMKKVTGVFQIVDSLLEKERRT